MDVYFSIYYSFLFAIGFLLYNLCSGIIEGYHRTVEQGERVINASNYPFFRLISLWGVVLSIFSFSFYQDWWNFFFVLVFSRVASELIMDYVTFGTIITNIKKYRIAKRIVLSRIPRWMETSFGIIAFILFNFKLFFMWKGI